MLGANRKCMVHSAGFRAGKAIHPYLGVWPLRNAHLSLALSLPRELSHEVSLSGIPREYERMIQKPTVGSSHSASLALATSTLSRGMYDVPYRRRYHKLYADARRLIKPLAGECLATGRRATEHLRKPDQNLKSSICLPHTVWCRVISSQGTI